MPKRFYFSLTFMLIAIVGFAQGDSIRHYSKIKKRASAYDTNAIYYNKGKLNLRLAIGFIFDNSYVSSYQNIPGVFGILNPHYSISYSPTYNFFADYGITPKSELGIGVSYQQDKLNPNSRYQYLSTGNVFWLATGIRYSHCIRSWKYFYYGVELGIILLKPNFDTNTFTERPSSPVPSTQVYYSYFLGMHLPVRKNLWFHFEGGGIMPIFNKGNSLIVNETVGLNYCFDTRNNSHKHSNISFASQLKEYHQYRIKPLFKRKTHDSAEYAPAIQNAKPDSAKIYREALRDSARAKHKRESLIWDSASIPNGKQKHLRSVYDTSSPYYNKSKINISIAAGNGYIESVIFYIFGTLNSNYNQTILPNFSAAADYGITRKSEIGIDFSFEQVNYTPTTAGANYSPGSIAVSIIEARYLHSMWSWKYFYYGFKLGVAFWNPSFNYNTFYNQPGNQFLQQPNLGVLLGARIPILKNLSIHGELDFTGQLGGVEYGLTYNLTPRKKKVLK